MSMLNGTESVDMDSSSMPSMTYSDISSGSVADPESMPLEQHQAHIQALGAHLQNNQSQQGQNPIHQQEQHRQYQPQHYQLHNYQTEKHPDHYQYNRPPQQQQPWQGDAPRYQTMVSNPHETDMPSLVYSDDRSSPSSMMQSTNLRRGQLAPGNAYHGPIGAGPGIGFGYEGMEEDQNDFLMSVLNMIPPDMNSGIPPVAYFNYDAEFPQRKMLGRGGNGLIRLAYWGARQCHVILKNLQEKDSTPVKTDLLFDKEVEVMRICGNHDNIVQFYGIANREYPDKVDRYMVMQYYEMGDLVNLIGKQQPDAPTLNEKLFLGLDIALGLDHLLGCGFHHGDLHPKNVLIETRPSPDFRGRYQARLTDFGLRRIRNNPSAVSSQPVAGVWRFMAPERLSRDRPRYNVQCDIFALGVIYWVMMAGRYPFKNDHSYTPGSREQRVEGTPDWYHTVYTQAWSENPRERQQNFEEIFQVFQHQLGLPITHSSAKPSSYVDPSQRQPHPVSPSSYYNPVSPSSTAYGRSIAGSSGRSGTMGGPTMVQAAAQGSTGTSSTRSSNPNHPRNRKQAVPDGRPARIGQRP